MVRFFRKLDPPMHFIVSESQKEGDQKLMVSSRAFEFLTSQLGVPVVAVIVSTPGLTFNAQLEKNPDLKDNEAITVESSGRFLGETISIIKYTA